MNTSKEFTSKPLPLTFNYPPIMDEPYQAIFNAGNFQDFLPWSLVEGLATDLVHKNFQESRTVLVRHRGLDIQLYVTPAGEDGFQWRRENAEIFMIQTSGQQEVCLRRNFKSSEPKNSILAESIDLEYERLTPETRYVLNSGEFLFIPAGYWFKARALSNSFTLAIPLMKKSAL